MGKCSTQELMEEQLFKSWQGNKLTIKIYLYIFQKGVEGVRAEVHHFCPPHHPHRLSAVSETLSEKEGSPVLGVPINMYCNSLYIEKNYCKVKFNFTLMAHALCFVLLSVGDVA